MPPCNPTSPVVDVTADGSAAAAGRKVPKTLTEEMKIQNGAKSASMESGGVSGIRPFPWNYLSDTTWTMMGSVFLLTIFFPGISMITLSTASGYGLYYALYKYNPPCRFVLEKIRSFQRFVFYQIGRCILLDTRDSSYLPWMAYGLVCVPLLFYWALNRHLTHGFEVTTFLLYHLMRLGPRYRFFAHHECLIHIEGHASKDGLYCNPWTLLTTGKRVPLSKSFRRTFTDHINSALVGPFYGSIPNSYGAAHNKIHHRWHNDTGDVHSNMDVDRTAGISSFVLWLPRFIAYWTGLSPVLLFWKRKEHGLLKMMLNGMLYYYGLSALVWYKCGALFFWAYWFYPHVEAIAFLGGIAYMWHSFSEESDPSNQYVNSMTILRGHDNIWNEDYHVVHHHETFVHWTEMPESFHRNKAHYVKCRATVFADCEQGLFFAWMFGKKWDEMTDFFVDMQYTFSNGDKNSDRLLNVREVAAAERTLRSKEDPAKVEADLAAHHKEVKEMLLKRLRYHYMGTRQEEWSEYEKRLNAGLREFDEKES